MCKIMYRKKKLNYINKKEENLSNVYNFKNDFNLKMISYFTWKLWDVNIRLNNVSMHFDVPMATT